ncbi:hypothetical protein HLRTI_002023 [Halorhabdus tiamatea SARL4B]|uniref:Uncharacterized protein n=1 Tax=Halorhabdus tiamatea SARL4B TaxID=1033806 RepID=U2F756_9EURY|nr:hypothetical protein HLRTI_002023 [Halorhabdus tiamatea SARL4B]
MEVARDPLFCYVRQDSAYASSTGPFYVFRTDPTFHVFRSQTVPYLEAIVIGYRHCCPESDVIARNTASRIVNHAQKCSLRWAFLV